MARKTAASADKTASAEPKSAIKKARVPLSARRIDVAIRPSEDLIRERAYGIWIAEGRPHGRDLAHWQRAKHELLAAR